MKFKDFLESVYMESNIEYGKTKSLIMHGRLKATQDLGNIVITFGKYLSYIHLTFSYVLIKLHLRNTPQSAQVIFDNERAKSMAPVQHAPENDGTGVVEQLKIWYTIFRLGSRLPS